MARKKRKSETLDKAIFRLAGMKSIDPALDLGNGITVTTVETQKTAFEAQLELYNQHLSDLDTELNALQRNEKLLTKTNKKILQAVGVQFGDDSDELEQVGGVRLSERKKPKRGNTNGGNSNTKPDA